MSTPGAVVPGEPVPIAPGVHGVVALGLMEPLPVRLIAPAHGPVLRDGKFGAAFGSYGWSGEAVGLVEDRLRGLKLRVPRPGVKVKLIPADEELAACAALGRELAEHLAGRAGPRHVDLTAPLARIA